MRQLVRKNNKEKNEKILTLKRRLLAHNNPRNPIVEQYRTIRSNIQFSNIDDNIKTIAFTSSMPGEGKSTTASNLATVYAQQGLKVLLVDADLRKPTAHYTFRLENHLGLTNILTKQATLLQAIQETEVPNLNLLTSGPVPPNPAELLSSSYVEELIQLMKENFDMVIFDTPPVLAVTDAQILSHKVDGTILVVSSNKTDKNASIKAKERLVKSNVKLLGVILNNLKSKENYYYYYSNN